MLGIVSPEDFEQSIKQAEIKPAKIEKKDTPGRKEGDKNVPEAIRKTIAEEALLGSKSEALAELFQVSKQSVSAYKNGANSTSTYNEPNRELANHVNGAKERIISRSSKKLNLALGKLTSDKMDDCSARELAGIAKDMSAIIRNMTPDEEPGGQQNNIQFVVFAPPMKSEEDYNSLQVIDIG